MAGTSRINRKVHVRFCGRLEVKFLRPTHLIFREDARRLVKDNAPQNFSLPTKMALHLLRQDTSDPKKGMRRKRKVIGWDDDARWDLLGLNLL